MIRKDKTTWYQRFVQSDRRILFGRNQWSESVHRVLPATAFVDDFEPGGTFCGCPVIRSSEIDGDDMVLNCVVGVRPVSVQRLLDEAGVDHLDYFAFLSVVDRPVKGISFWSGHPGSPELTDPRYTWLMSELSDEESRETLQRMVHFRSLLDLSQMQVFSDRQEDQYFEPFLELTEREVFFDVGAFDGMTSRRFCTEVSKFEEIHLFEPQFNLLEAAVSSLESTSKIFGHPFALGDENKSASLSIAGSASKIGDVEGDIIDVRCLDSLAISDPTFIKVDIEGFEHRFLDGAQQTLMRARPKLAIAAYHHWEDPYTIAARALTLLGPSSLYFRHYTEGFTESVLFAIPVTRQP